MDFKMKCLRKALEQRIYRIKLVHGNKGWFTIGLVFMTLFSAGIVIQKTADASAINNIAIANSSTSSYVQLYKNVTSSSIGTANRGLVDGTAWKTARAVKGSDGNIYVLVGKNEYANVNQMDLQDETSTQRLLGIVRVGDGNGRYVPLYMDPMTSDKKVANRALDIYTDWKTDKRVIVNGVVFYRVATGEWIKGNEAKLISENSRSDKTYLKNGPDEATVIPDPNPDTNTNNNNGGSTTKPVIDKADVTIRVVDGQGKSLGQDTVISNREVGKNYIASAPNVDGYTATETTKSVNVSKGGSIVTFLYTKNEIPVTQSTITVRYQAIDKDGNQVDIADPATEKVDNGQPYTATANPVEGYTLPKESTQKIASVNGNQTITFLYTKNEIPVTQSTITVRYQAIDKDGNQVDIADPATEKVDNGQPYTATANPVEGYTLPKESTQKIASVNGDQTIIFIYDPIKVPATINIRYVDQDGHDIPNVNEPTTDTTSYVGATNHGVIFPQIKGYSKTGDDSGYKWRFVDTVKDGMTVELTYASNKVKVTTYYKDKDGNEMPGHEPTTELVSRGTNFTKDYTYIREYRLIGNEKQTITNINGDTDIIFTYEPLVRANFIIHYTSKDVKVLENDDKDYSYNGNSFTATAIDIPGYTLVGDKTQTIDPVNGDAEITFMYVPIMYQITTKYQTQDGTEVHEPTVGTVKSGNAYTATAIPVIGYAVKGDATKTIYSITDNQTVTFVYDPSNFKVTTRYVKAVGAGYEDIDKQLTAEVGNGGSYSATAKEIAGYTLDSPVTVKLDPVSQDETILFVYKPIKVPATINIRYVDQDGHDIPNVNEPTTDTTSYVGATNHGVIFPQIKGYSKTGDDSGYKWRFVDTVKDGMTVELTYASNKVKVTTYYKDKDGNEMPGHEPTTELVSRGTNFTKDYTYIREYRLIGNEKQTITNINGDTDIIFTYEPLVRANFIIHYTSKDVKVLENDDKDYSYNGNSFTATAIDIPGYTLVGDKTQTIDPVNGDAEITFMYVPIA